MLDPATGTADPPLRPQPRDWKVLRCGIVPGDGDGIQARRRAAAKKSAQSSRAEQSVQAFRDALEKSVTISRDRLQEVIDDAVRRGRMTRGDADEMLGRLVTRGRDQADDLLGQLERLLSQVREAPGRARQEVGPRSEGPEAGRQGGRQAAGRRRQGPPGRPRSRLPDHRLRRALASGRSTAGSRSSASRSSARSATTSAATSPARASCAPSTASSRSSGYGFAIKRVRLAARPRISECLAALLDLRRELVERLRRGLSADRQLGELLAHVLGRLVQGVAPVRDLILGLEVRLRRTRRSGAPRRRRCSSARRPSPSRRPPAGRRSPSGPGLGRHRSRLLPPWTSCSGFRGSARASLYPADA